MPDGPFTAEQCAAIAAWQALPHFHGLTCVRDGSQLLEVHQDGMRCPRCLHRQTWVPEFVLTPPTVLQSLSPLEQFDIVGVIKVLPDGKMFLIDEEMEDGDD